MSICIFIQLERQPIHYASSGGHKALIVELIEQHGVDPEAEDSVNINL